MKYKGKQLNPLHVIARRLIAYPFLQAFRFLFCLAVLVGWGTYDAQRMWEETE
jgi:hypothetical protein